MITIPDYVPVVAVILVAAQVVLALLAIIAITYIITRVVAIALYKTKQDYDPPGTNNTFDNYAERDYADRESHQSDSPQPEEEKENSTWP